MGSLGSCSGSNLGIGAVGSGVAAVNVVGAKVRDVIVAAAAANALAFSCAKCSLCAF